MYMVGRRPAKGLSERSKLSGQKAFTEYGKLSKVPKKDYPTTLKSPGTKILTYPCQVYEPKLDN